MDLLSMTSIGMVHRLLLSAKSNATLKAWDELTKGNKWEAAIRKELLCHSVPQALHRLILDYCPLIQEQLGLRVGKWAHTCYGGEPRYFVTLDGHTSSHPMVQYGARACPALDALAVSGVKRQATDPVDHGMVVHDDKAGQLTIRFPSNLVFREHYGYHVRPFETIGIRYRTGPHRSWILLCQIRNRHSLSHNLLSDSLTVQITYRDESPLHYISEIVIRDKPTVVQHQH